MGTQQQPNTSTPGQQLSRGEHAVPAHEVVVESLSCSIGGRTIVRDVNFTVPAATMTALVGVNGVGKSTLLRCLAGISTPDTGEVRINNTPVHTLGHKQRAHVLTLVGQEEAPPADLTIEEMVQLGRLPYSKPWQLGNAEDRAAVTEALEHVGLSDMAKRPCHQLSGGQRRRALIARGFAQRTPVVMLDEPTNHLDVHHQLHLLQVLRQSGRTIIATIHDLDLAMSHFDQVVILHQGTLLRAGDPATVLDTPTVREAFDVSAATVRIPESNQPHLIIHSL